jgi:RNA polymerase-binding transcription factor
MDEKRARTMLQAERAEVQRLLTGTQQAEEEERPDLDDVSDSVDPAQALTAQGNDEAIAGSLSDRLAAIDRALHRLDEGTYGRSVRSGVPIPDARLEADPAAELTVEEASRA